MTRSIIKKTIITFTAAALVMVSGTNFLMAATSEQVSQGAVSEAKSKAKEAQVKVVQQAVDALMLTHKVLDDLDANNTDEAIKDIEKAIGKLEVVLAGDHAPAMLPIDSTIVAKEYTGDVKSVREAVKEVKNLLGDNKIQDARRVLDVLQSEIDVITINLPLVSYPQALKLAAKYLHKNKVEEARDVLEMALTTLVRDEIVIPIPLLKAEALVDEAKKTAKKDKDQALKHLEAARTELEMAEVLGYTSTSDTTYKKLHEAISSVETEIKGKNEAEKLFDELKAKLKNFKEKAVKIMHHKKDSN